MRFMLMVKSSMKVEPTAELMQAMGALIEREIKAGRLVDTAGLMPRDMGLEVRVADGALEIVEGPFADQTPAIGGYAIFDFETREEASANAVEFMKMHMDHLPNWSGVCEVRQIAA